MIQRTVAIHQPQYLPYLGFFHKIFHSDVFVLLDDVQFQKGGFQNRNRIKTDKGWQWITVPVLHDSKQLISQVRINTTVPWQRKHWAALKTNYARAPYFDSLGSQLEPLYQQDWKGLTDLNVALITWAMSSLGISTRMVYSSSLQTTSEATDRLVQICQEVGATRYLSGPGGRQYMDENAFSRASIEIAWQQFSSPVYDQVFPEAGFEGNMSVVDALFCCGMAAKQFLL